MIKIKTGESTVANIAKIGYKNASGAFEEFGKVFQVVEGTSGKTTRLLYTKTVTVKAPTISVSDSGGNDITVTITLNANNDPVKYRVIEYAPDGTNVYNRPWTEATSSIEKVFSAYSYTKYVTVEAYSYRDSDVSDTVSQNYTLSRTPYIDMPSISLTDEGGGSVSCSISGTGTVYYEFSVYDDEGSYAGGDSGEGDYFYVTITDYTDSWGLGKAELYVSAYSEAYGITSDSDATTICPAFA